MYIIFNNNYALLHLIRSIANTVIPIPLAPSLDFQVNPMLAEEAKLKAKYPNVGRPMAGHSAFLQKRLQKGVRIAAILRQLSGAVVPYSYLGQSCLSLPHASGLISNDLLPLDFFQIFKRYCSGRISVTISPCSLVNPLLTSSSIFIDPYL